MVLFVLFCIIILAGIFLVGFFSMHLTKKIFHLDGVDTATTWKIVLYTFLPMLLPILGIFLAVYIFRSILNRIQKTSWPKTLGMFFIYFLISTILGVGFVLSARSVVSPFRMSGNSMESTLSNGRFMMVYRLDSSYQR